MYKQKTGITVSMVVLLVVIISILTSTITISVSNTLKNSKLRAFATEISYIQNTVDEYNYTTSNITYIKNEIKVIPESEYLTTQFSNEKDSNGNVTLYTLDLQKLGIEDTVYGKGKDTTDVYAISLETNRVFYVKGYEAPDKIYYTLTEDLKTMVSGDDGVQVVSKNIVFVPNVVGWANQPIRITVKVPKEFNNVVVSTSIDEIVVGSAVISDTNAYTEIVVNTGDYAGNYTITVSYTEDGTNKTQTYSVETYDVTAPTITVGEQTRSTAAYDKSFYAYIENVSATDDNKLKTLKYATVEVSSEDAKEYFANKGVNIVNNSNIRIEPYVHKYTIYAEDYAGNVTIQLVEVESDIYEMVKNWDETWPGVNKQATGTNELTISATGANLINYTIYGNSVQNATPSVKDPVEIQSVGDKTVNLLPDDVFDESSYIEAYNMTYATVYKLPFIEAGKQYTISFDYTNVAGAVYYYLYKYKDGESVLQRYLITNNTEEGYNTYTFTAEDSAEYYFYGNNSTYLPKLFQNVSNFQIQEGRVATDYEPYGKYKIPMRVSGSRNIGDFPQDTTLTSVAAETLNYVRIGAQNVIGLKNNEKYVITFDYEVVDTNTDYYLGTAVGSRVNGLSYGLFNEFLYHKIYTTNSAETKGTKQLVVTTKDDIDFNTYPYFTLSVICGKAEYIGTASSNTHTGEIKITNVMFSKYSEDIDDYSYEPYMQSIINIYLDEPLRKVGDYVDYIDLKNKNLVRQVSTIVYDGSSDEGWVVYNSASSPYYSYMITNNLTNKVIAKQCMSNRLEGISSYANIYYGTTLGCYLGNTNHSTPKMAISSEKSTVADLRLQLAEYPLDVIFGLATQEEYTIELPDLPTYRGTTTIEVLTEIPPSSTVVNYYTKGT